MDFSGTAVRIESGDMIGVAASAIAANKTFSVTVTGTTIVARAARDLTLAVGDVVALRRLNGYLLAYARLYASAPAAPVDEAQTPPPAPEPVVTTGRLTVSPVETRSYRPGQGWRTDNDDVYQGQYGGNGNHTGCVFYGDGPRSLRGATVTSASIRVKRVSGGDYAARQTTLRQITQRRKPGGAPTFTGGSTNGPKLAVGASDKTISVPAGFAQALVDGTAGGFAIYDAGGAPYVRLAGRGAWSGAWTLTINWKRNG